MSPASRGSDLHVAFFVFLQRAHYDWRPATAVGGGAHKLVREPDHLSVRASPSCSPISAVRLLRCLRLSAQAVSEQQRLGLTFVWKKGRQRSIAACTANRRRNLPVEGLAADPQQARNFVVRYPLPDGGNKTVTFLDNHIRVASGTRGRDTCPASTASSPQRNPSPVPLPCANMAKAAPAPILRPAVPTPKVPFQARPCRIKLPPPASWSTKFGLLRDAQAAASSLRWLCSFPQVCSANTALKHFITFAPCRRRPSVRPRGGWPLVVSLLALPVAAKPAHLP